MTKALTQVAMEFAPSGELLIRVGRWPLAEQLELARAAVAAGLRVTLADLEHRSLVEIVRLLGRHRCAVGGTPARSVRRARPAAVFGTPSGRGTLHLDCREPGAGGSADQGRAATSPEPGVRFAAWAGMSCGGSR